MFDMMNCVPMTLTKDFDRLLQQLTGLEIQGGHFVSVFCLGDKLTGLVGVQEKN